MGEPPTAATAPSVDTRVRVLRLLKVMATVLPCSAVGSWPESWPAPDLTVVLCWWAFRTSAVSSVGERSAMESRCRGAKGDVAGAVGVEERQRRRPGSAARPSRASGIASSRIAYCVYGYFEHLNYEHDARGIAEFALAEGPPAVAQAAQVAQAEQADDETRRRPCSLLPSSLPSPITPILPPATLLSHEPWTRLRRPWAQPEHPARAHPHTSRPAPRAPTSRAAPRNRHLC